jgi:hypothetical protein
LFLGNRSHGWQSQVHSCEGRVAQVNSYFLFIFFRDGKEKKLIRLFVCFEGLGQHHVPSSLSSTTVRDTIWPLERRKKNGKKMQASVSSQFFFLFLQQNCLFYVCAFFFLECSSCGGGGSDSGGWFFFFFFFHTNFALFSFFFYMTEQFFSASVPRE